MTAKRLEKLQKAVKSASLDAALLTSAENIRYFSGFSSADGFVLVTREKAILFTDFRYLIQAKAETSGVEVREITRTNAVEVFAAAVKEHAVASVGCEQENLTVARFTQFQPLGLAWEPFGGAISAPRMIKTAPEIESLKKAQIIADRAYSELLDRVKPGMTELEVAAELNYLCARLGSEGPSFDPIVGSGPNGAMCHARPGNRKLTNGDLVVVDFGCVVDGYHSDMTRTFGIGELDPELIKVYDVVLEAQTRCLEALKPGITGKELDAIAREYIASEGYGDCFGHGLGHGFGLLIHEAPTASAASTDTLKAGMTVTIEPGIYLEGRGGVRIEDCCVLTKDGHIDLVSTSGRLVIL